MLAIKISQAEQVVEVSTSKTRNHGHGKCHFVEIDIFNKKKLEDIVPSCHCCDVKKFKDALSKHNTERCYLVPAKGLDEFELLALFANKDLCLNYTKKEEKLVFTIAQIMEEAPIIAEIPFREKPILEWRRMPKIH